MVRGFIKGDRMKDREEKERVYIEYGNALDCLERLSRGQLKILRAAIDSELKERQKKRDESNV